MVNSLGPFYRMLRVYLGPVRCSLLAAYRSWYRNESYRIPSFPNHISVFQVHPDVQRPM